MHETLKNVCIFIIFLMTLVLWDRARGMLAPYFNFRYGDTALLLVWSTAVVVIFHALYHYLGKQTEKVTYMATVFAFVALAGLCYYDKVHLA